MSACKRLRHDQLYRTTADLTLAEKRRQAMVKIVVAQERHIHAVALGAVNAAAQEMMERGVRLSHEQADEIGDMGIAWLRSRLSLTITTDDSGVLAVPRS